MKMELRQAGNWVRMLDGDARVMAESQWYGTDNAGKAMTRRVRDDVRKAGFKRAAAVANTWRGKTFPRSASAQAAKPAYVLGNKWLEVIEAHASGATVEFEGGYGVVPFGRGMQIVRGLRPGTPRESWLEEAQRIYGRLVTQYAKRTGRLMLGTFTTLEGGRKRFIALGVIVRQVQLTKRLRHAELIERDAAMFGQNVADETWRRFAAKASDIGRARIGADEVRVTRVGG